MTTDEIYERYLHKAIAEINELWDELGADADALHVPVLGSGHPARRRLPAQVVAADRRRSRRGSRSSAAPGQALLKSLERLHVDPLAVYGTNCLKFGTEEPEQAAAWLTRELHVVQPKLLVAMGDEAVSFLNGLALPALRPARRRTHRRAAAVHGRRSTRSSPRRSTRARRAGREERVLERLQGARPLVGRAAALLVDPRHARARSRPSPRCSPSSRSTPRSAARCRDEPTGSTSPVVAFVVIPVVFAFVWLCCRGATRAGVLGIGVGLGVLALLLDLAGLETFFDLAKLAALTLIGFWFLSVFEELWWTVLVAAIVPWVDALSVWRGPTEYDRLREAGTVRAARVRLPRPGRGRASRSSGRPTSSSSRSSSRPPPASAAAGLDVDLR